MEGGGDGRVIPFGEQRLSSSVRRGHLSAHSAAAAVKWADSQLRTLVEVVVKYGRQGDDGKVRINFGVLYDKSVNKLEVCQARERAEKEKVGYRGRRRKGRTQREQERGR